MSPAPSSQTITCFLWSYICWLSTWAHRFSDCGCCSMCFQDHLDLCLFFRFRSAPDSELLSFSRFLFFLLLLCFLCFLCELLLLTSLCLFVEAFSAPSMLLQSPTLLASLMDRGRENTCYCLTRKSQPTLIKCLIFWSLSLHRLLDNKIQMRCLTVMPAEDLRGFRFLLSLLRILFIVLSLKPAVT